MQEQIDGRVIDVMRKLQREAQDDEYESSTPAAGRWRERTGSPRRDHDGAATSRPVSDDRVAEGDTTRFAQRHRFGRTLDLPPVNREARGDWLVWLTLTGLVLWAIGAGVIWWLA